MTIERLRQIVDAVPDGPWIAVGSVHDEDGRSRDVIDGWTREECNDAEVDDITVVVRATYQGWTYEPIVETDDRDDIARYVATFDPPTLRALLDVYEQATLIDDDALASDWNVALNDLDVAVEKARALIGDPAPEEGS